MKINTLKNLIKETFFELIAEDKEFQNSVLSFISERQLNNSTVVKESKKEPADANLYDQLLLVSQGKLSELKFNKKIVRAPNEGIGFKGKDRVLEWANKAYNKLGGEWKEVVQEDGMIKRISDTSEFLSIFGGDGNGNGSAIRQAAAINDDIALKKYLGNSQMLTEEGQVDISELLIDTAKTTLQGFPVGHDTSGNVMVNGGARSVVPDPIASFGQEQVNAWAMMAFQDKIPNK